MKLYFNILKFLYLLILSIIIYTTGNAYMTTIFGQCGRMLCVITGYEMMGWDAFDTQAIGCDVFNVRPIDGAMDKFSIKQLKHNI